MDYLLNFIPVKLSYFIAVICFIPFWGFWIYLRRRKPRTYELSASISAVPLPLYFGLLDHLKAFISWLFLFMRVFAIKPGLYYTGKRYDRLQDEKTPILVTCNNFLSIFLLARRIKSRSVRLIVVDTGGINVWCSAAKGRFSASEILDKAGRAGLLKERQKIEMILPKFSLAGVNLAELKKAGIHPIIGPMYAKDVPAYLDEGKFEDRIHDRVYFGFQSRAFAALPTAVQFLLYFLGAYVVMLGFISHWTIWIATGLAFLYPILFPYLWGKQFAVKGIFLGFLASILAGYFFYTGKLSTHLATLLILFMVATSMFIALSFTGNSAVSNYSRIRKEIARFLPAVVVLYLSIIPVFLLS